LLYFRAVQQLVGRLRFDRFELLSAESQPAIGSAGISTVVATRGLHHGIIEYR
jgi:hypothetical protein